MDNVKYFAIIVLLYVITSPCSGQLHHGLQQQQQQPVILKETQHLQAIQQAHLPKDTNVLAETQRFLKQFAQLKALADAAPDPLPEGQPGTYNTQPIQQNPQTNQIPTYSIHENVGKSIVQHVPEPQVNVNYNQPIQSHHQAPQQTFQQHQAVPHHQANTHSIHQPTRAQPLMVPVVNKNGVIINPNRYPGLLAHHLPANVVALAG